LTGDAEPEVGGVNKENELEHLEMPALLEDDVEGLLDDVGDDLAEFRGDANGVFGYWKRLNSFEYL
jgi:hypothetical protein